MRKFSKILTILLSIALVFGIALVISTAADEATSGATHPDGYAFTVSDGDGNLLYGGQATDDFVKKVNEYNGTKDEIKVKLYSNIEMNDIASFLSTATAFEVKAGKAFDLDLNGYRIEMKICATSNPLMFNLTGDGAEVSIYSSRPGAVIDKYMKNTAADKASELTRGNAVVGSSKLPTCNVTVNFGNGTQNLTVSSPMLVRNGSDNNTFAKGHTFTDKKMTVNINGGTYVRSINDTLGLIHARDNVHINIENATLAATYNTSSNILGSQNTYAVVVTGTINNCTLYSNGAIFSNLSNASSITITNSYLDGKITFTDSDSKVTLGDGTKYTSDITPGTQIVIPDDCKVAEDTVKKTIAFNHTTPTYDASTGITISSASYSKEETFNSIYAMENIKYVNVTFGTVGDPVYATGSVIAGNAVKHPTLSVPSIVTVSGAPKLLCGWALTEGATEAEEIIATGNSMQVYPVYKNPVYEIRNGDEVLKYGASGYDLFDDYAEFSGDYSELTVVLMADIEIGGDKIAGQIVPPANSTLNFDVNGKVLSRFSVDAKKVIFLMKYEGSTLNLYSSQPDGTIKVGAYYTETGKINGTAVIDAKNVNTTVNIGNDTQNLSVYAPTIFDSNGLQRYDSNTGADLGKENPNTKATVTINGGTYVRNNSDSMGLIIIRHHVELTVTNATLAQADGTTGYIIGCDDRFFHSVKATFDGCTFRSSMIIGALTEGSSITITDSILSGKIPFSKSQIKGNTSTLLDDGDVILGEGVTYDFELPEQVKIASGCAVLNVSKEDYVVWNTYTYVYDTATGVWSTTEYTNMTETTTIIGKVLNEDDVPKVITVVWYNADGSEELARETYYEGETASYKGALLTGERVDTWFVKGIIGWQNERGKENLVVSSANCNFFAVEGNVLDIAALYNFQTMTAFVAYVYIPVPTADSGIKITAVYDSEKLSTGNIMGQASRQGKNVLIGGIEYYQFIHNPGANDTQSKSYTVEYTYGDATGRYRIDTSTIAEYFARILADEKQCDEAKVLAVNAANYCHQVLKYIDSSKALNYEDILNNYSELIVDVDDKTIAADYSYNVDAIAKYVSGVRFVIGDGYRPLYAFTPANDSITEVKWYYTSNNGVKQYKTSTSGTHWEGWLGSGANVGVYDIRETITIYFTDGEETYKGTYSLAAYYDYLTKIAEPTAQETQAIEVVKALYSYSIASYNYKTRPQTAN